MKEQKFLSTDDVIDRNDQSMITNNIEEQKYGCQCVDNVEEQINEYQEPD